MNSNVIDMYKRSAADCRPHVVILGAGASCAAIPNGDKSGKKIPVMKGFLKALKLENLLDGVKLHTKSDNIEDIYSELAERPECTAAVQAIETAIVRIMSNFQIPDEPTIYDYLLLSLRKKDLIASFNWDPLLLQAYYRVIRITKRLPTLCFLHGNVACGYSTCEHKRVGRVNSFCPICHRPLTPVPLLYPVQHKDYATDWWIKEQWDIVARRMEEAGALTIFGYSAPKSDIEAINLLKKGWGPSKNKVMQQIEFIDLKEQGELEYTWRDFIFNDHCESVKSFFESKLALYPRRTIEADIECFYDANFISHENSCLKNGMTFEQILEHLKPLLRDEESKSA